MTTIVTCNTAVYQKRRQFISVDKLARKHNQPTSTTTITQLVWTTKQKIKLHICNSFGPAVLENRSRSTK